MSLIIATYKQIHRNNCYSPLVICTTGKMRSILLMQSEMNKINPAIYQYIQKRKQSKYNFDHISEVWSHNLTQIAVTVYFNSKEHFIL